MNTAIERIVKRAAMVGLLSAAGASLAGNTCTWTGLGGDNKWSTSANWDTPPVSGNGDALVLNDAGTTENDIDNLVVGSMAFGGTAAAVLDGKKVTFAGFSGLSALLTGTVALTVNAPLALTAGRRGSFACQTVGKDTTFNGAIALGDGSVLRLGANALDSGVSPKLTFNAPVEGPNAELVTSHGVNGNPRVQGGIWFNAPVHVQKLAIAMRTGANYVHFCAPGNTWEISSLQYANLKAETAGAFCPTAVLDWYNGEVCLDDYWNYYYLANDYKDSADDVTYGTWRYGVYDLGGYDQTVDRLAGHEPTNSSGTFDTFSVYSGTAATLTLKATADGLTYSKIIGLVSLVWDPQGDFTQTFQGRVSKTGGTIEVRRGSVRVTGAGTFPKVPSIVVKNGASFVLDSTAANALAGLQSLTLAANATFSVAATASTPFGSSTPVLALRSTSRLVVPEGTTLNVRELFLDGRRIYGQTYDGTAEDWLTGGGQLVVAEEGEHANAVWMNAVDGAWNAAGNWLGGAVPAADEAAEVSVPYDGNYAATISGDLTYNGDLTVANVLGGTATVEIASGTWTRGGTKLVLNAGGSIAVDDGATLAFVADYKGVKVAGGSLVVKDGGKVKMNVSPGGSTTVNGGGVVRVEEGGVLNYKGQDVDTKTSRAFNIGSGGLLEVAGLAKFAANAYWGHSLYLSGGDILAKGSGALDVRVVQQGGIFGNGTVTMSGSSTLYVTNAGVRAQIPTGRDQTLEKTTITFSDNAKLKASSALLLGNNRLNKVANDRNEATLNFCSTATSTSENSVYLGIPNGLATLNQTRGTVSISASLHAGTCYALSNDILPYFYWAAETWRPEGRINVSGGTLSVVGATWDVMAQSSQGQWLYGLVLGNGVMLPTVENPYAADYDAKGSLNLSGGTVTLGSFGNLVVGAGFASGAVDQTGGSLDVPCSKYGAVVGFLGGTGSYSIGGGTAAFGGDLFVGGVTKSEIAWNSLSTTGTRYQKASVDAATHHDAVGTLTVTGGTMTVAKRLVLSADGTGSLVVGECGTLTAANIELRDGTAAGGGKSSVTFKLGPAGSGLVKTTGTLTVAPGTRLVVDASDYEGEVGVRLLSCGSMAGMFAAEDITFVPPRGRGCRLSVSETGISMSSGRGAMIILR